MNCANHPNRKSTMDSPDDLCDLCWVMWFTAGYSDMLYENSADLLFPTALTLTQERISLLRDMWKDHPISKHEQIEQEKEVAELTEKEYVQ